VSSSQAVLAALRARARVVGSQRGTRLRGLCPCLPFRGNLRSLPLLHPCWPVGRGRVVPRPQGHHPPVRFWRNSQLWACSSSRASGPQWAAWFCWSHGCIQGFSARAQQLCLCRPKRLLGSVFSYLAQTNCAIEVLCGVASSRATSKLRLETSPKGLLARLLPLQASLLRHVNLPREELVLLGAVAL